MLVSVSPQRRQQVCTDIAGLGQDFAQDSIKVAVRFRPLNTKERAGYGRRSNESARDDANGDDSDAWHVLRGPSHSVAQVGVPRVSGQTQFAFDYIFNGSDSSRAVYEATCRPVVEGATSGIDGTIFAYGQTGSGKTFTMQGPRMTASANGRETNDNNEEDGILQMAAHDVFRYIDSHPEREFLIRTSYFEVYNEVVRDLLTRKSPPPTVTVREDPKTRGGVHINATEVVVTDCNSLVETLYLGNRNRSVATTNMNARSSRSHAIFRITLESREKYADGLEDGGDFSDEMVSIGSDDRAVLVSTLNLVDLAGSESVRCTGATGRRSREGGKINQSLLALSSVIHSLSQPLSKRPKYINYRDSKLTRILQPSLSGNALTAVLCCASPSTKYVEETRSTLKFASRAKVVQVHARKNEVMDDRALIRRLQRELATAKRLLAEAEERERQHLGKARDSASVQGAREKLARLKSIILRSSDLRLDNEQRRQRLSIGAALPWKSKNHPLSALIDPEMWRKVQNESAYPGKFISCSRMRVSKNGKERGNFYRYSVVDMPIDDSVAMPRLTEEYFSSHGEPGNARSEISTFKTERSSMQHFVDDQRLLTTRPSRSLVHRATSEIDILREALASKCNSNRHLNNRIEELEAQVVLLRSELGCAKQEASTMKLKKGGEQVKIDNLLVENAMLKEHLCILPQVSFWNSLLRWKKLNLLECCWPQHKP